MSQTLLLVDMIDLNEHGIVEEAVRLIRERLRASSWQVYRTSDAFFRQETRGRVDAETVERAIDGLERALAERMGRVRGSGLPDVVIGLLASPSTPQGFLLQLAEACTARATRLPLVLTMQEQEHGPVLVDAPRLPLKWRCLEGDAVSLVCDVWLDGEYGAEGQTPAFPRGSTITVVERSVHEGSDLVRDRFLSVAAPQERDAILSLVIPWSLVVHPSARVVGETPHAPAGAVAAFRLPGWYSVQVEEASEPE